MYCSSCGKEIPESTNFCPHCGASQTAPVAKPIPSADDEDKASIILIIISFLFPIVGWILYFVKKEDMPNAAKKYAYWAWGGFGLNLLITLCNL